MAEIYGSNRPGAASVDHRASKWTGIAIAVAVILALIIAYALWQS